MIVFWDIDDTIYDRCGAFSSACESSLLMLPFALQEVKNTMTQKPMSNVAKYVLMIYPTLPL